MDWYESLSKRGVDLGLDRITELMHLLGDPQDSLRLIHVAGSDGKGSVCAMISSILSASGYVVGTFTTPHVMRVNECLGIDGEDINDADLDMLMGIVREKVGGMSLEPTQFEVLTAVALLDFHMVGVDYAVIEVGMGGRLDSTNIIVPQVSVINNISLEHTAYLGDTIEEIAFEKAGIIKPGVPCATMNSGPALEVIRERAAACGSHLSEADESELELTDNRPDGIDITYRGVPYSVSVPGRHQSKNAALAIEAVALLPDYDTVISDHVEEGLSNVSWPCRMQKMIDMPIVIDVTHTRKGAECLASDVSEIYGKVVLVIGMLSDKDVEGSCKVLAHIADTVIATQPDSPRAAPAQRVYDAMAGCHGHVILAEDVATAMDIAMDIRGDRNILVTGSFRMAEDCLRWYQRSV